MAEDKNVQNEKGAAVEVLIKEVVLKYVAEGNSINFDKAKRALKALAEVANKVRGAAKKQIEQEQAALATKLKELG